jgi:hypothetical protein
VAAILERGGMSLMISQKVRQILVPMDAPFTTEEMDDMTDREGWDWIYDTKLQSTGN